jgi:hypothetical protein
MQVSALSAASAPSPACPPPLDGAWNSPILLAAGRNRTRGTALGNARAGDRVLEGRAGSRSADRDPRKGHSSAELRMFSL